MEPETQPRPMKAIIAAWTIEICAVALGMVNAYMTSLDRTDLPRDRAAMMAAPFAMIAVAELSRIPLVNLFFYTRQRVIAWACMLAVIATAGLTIENFAFGIERLVTLRAQNVTDARKEQRIAEEYLSNVLKLRDDALSGLQEKRRSLQSSREASLAEVARLEEQIREVEAGRQRDTEQHTERCKAAGSRCNSAPYLKVINDQANSRLEPLEEERRAASARVTSIEEEIRKITDEESARRAKSENDQGVAQAKIADARQKVSEIIDDSQMHRIAAMWGTVNCRYIQAKEDCNITPQTVSDEEFNTVRTFFSLFSATIISLMGTMLAIGYYSEGKSTNYKSRLREARLHLTHARTKLLRALRGLAARRRKKLVRTIEKVVEVPVDREVEKLVEVTREVPVDRVVEKEVIKEVPVERVVEKPVEIIKEVPVDRVVIQTVEKVVEVPVEHQKVVEVTKEVPVEVQKVVKEIVDRPVVHVRETIRYVPESWRGAVETKQPSDTSVVVDLEPKRAHQ